MTVLKFNNRNVIQSWNCAVIKSVRFCRFEPTNFSCIILHHSLLEGQPKNNPKLYSFFLVLWHLFRCSQKVQYTSKDSHTCLLKITREQSLLFKYRKYMVVTNDSDVFGRVRLIARIYWDFVTLWTRNTRTSKNPVILLHAQLVISKSIHRKGRSKFSISAITFSGRRHCIP